VESEASNEIKERIVEYPGSLTLGLGSWAFFHPGLCLFPAQSQGQKMIPVVVAGVNLSPGSVLQPRGLAGRPVAPEVLPPQTAET